MSKQPWFTTELAFQHQRAMNAAEQLSKEELLDILKKVHKQALFHERAFRQLFAWCGSQALMPPPLDVLLEPSEVVCPSDEM
jgi:hypothetical protein